MEYAVTLPSPNEIRYKPPQPAGHTAQEPAAACLHTTAFSIGAARAEQSRFDLGHHGPKHPPAILREPHLTLANVVDPPRDRQLLTRYRSRHRGMRPQMLQLQQH